MDHKEKYEHALGWMRSVYPTMSGADKEEAEKYFPELKETEDERIRKFLVYFITVCSWSYKKDQGWPLREDCITWLEKQKPLGYVHHIDTEGKYTKEPILESQTPNPFSGTSFKYNGHTYGMCARDNGVEIAIDSEIAARVFPGQKPIKWSDEDDTILNRIIREYKNKYEKLFEDNYGHKEIIDDLKCDCRENLKWLESIKQKIGVK